MSRDEVNRYLARQLKPVATPENVNAASNLECKAEKVLQESIATYLRLNEIPFFRQRMDKRATGCLGWPDFSFVLLGRACFFECKVAGRDLSDEQKQVRAQLLQAGARYGVITSLLEAIRKIQEWSEPKDEQ